MRKSLWRQVITPWNSSWHGSKAIAQIILSSDQARERWAELNPFLWYGATPLGAVATVAAYTAGLDHLVEVVDYLRVGRDLFADAIARTLPEARMAPLQGTYLAWLDLRDIGCDPADVAGLTGVRGVDGLLCGTPGFLRLNLGMPHHLVTEMATRLGALAR